MPDLAQRGPGPYLYICTLTPCICLQTPTGLAPSKGAELPLPEKGAFEVEGGITQEGGEEGAREEEKGES